MYVVNVLNSGTQLTQYWDQVCEVNSISNLLKLLFWSSIEKLTREINSNNNEFMEVRLGT